MKKPASLSVHIPVSLVRKSGRKRILLPDHAPLPQLDPEQNEHLILVLLRSHKWQKLIATGKVKTAEELASQLAVSHTYVCRVLRLNLLAPDIKQAILDGRQPKGLRVFDILKPLPLLWSEQRSRLGFS